MTIDTIFADTPALIDPDFATQRESALRPRDSATVLLLDRRLGDVRVLMGRRHPSHVFMAGKFVFPGGRTDPADGRLALSNTLHPVEEARISAGVVRGGSARARAIGISAIRETLEETGVLIGQPGTIRTSATVWRAFTENGLEPSLNRLRLVARAITPPRNIRRFDTRFFAVWHEPHFGEVEQGHSSNELQELCWPTLSEALALDIPTITRSILEDVIARLQIDPELSPGGPASFYRMVGKRHIREPV